MFLSKYSKGFLLILFIAAPLLYSQERPFPQSIDYQGCIKPDNITETQINQTVQDYYDHWKSEYLKQGEYVPNSYYISGGNTGGSDSDKGTSEGHGYGMIITAIMAGYDQEAKEEFDGLYRMFDATRSTINSELMGWLITAEEDGENSSAADGDLDIAYSLILAHEQWGSDGEIDYYQEAVDMITQGIKEDIIHPSSKRIMLGDWDSDQYTTRSSDWMADHLRLFYGITKDPVFDQAAATIYSIVGSIQSNHSSSTGLMPDFAVDDPPQPAEPNFLEFEYDGDYYYNACRFPMRIAADYAHYQTPNAQESLNSILTWIKEKTGNDPGEIKTGYTLEGDAIQNYFDASFAAPLVTAAIADATHQEWLNQGWDMIKNSKEGYYSDTINFLCMLLISGNWWNPDSETSGTTQKTVEVNVEGQGSVTLDPSAETYDPGTDVTAAAAADSGYVFAGWSGDISGLEPETGFTVNASMEIKALFRQEEGDDSDLIEDFEDGDDINYLGGSWYTYTDTAESDDGAGESVIEPGAGTTFIPEENGVLGSDYAAHITYTIDKGTLPYNGYVGLGFTLSQTEDSAVDISSAEGISFYYKGDGCAVQIETQGINDYAYYKYEIPSSTEWSFVEIAWEDFNQPSWGETASFDLTSAKNVNFEVSGPDGSGELYIDNIRFPGYDIPEQGVSRDNVFSENRRGTGHKIEVKWNGYTFPIHPDRSNGKIGLALFDLRGRCLLRESVDLSGSEPITLKSAERNLGQGTYMLRYRSSKGWRSQQLHLYE